MALTKSRGNMYPFVTHTWNAIKGICFHDCPYCYMKKFDGLLPIRFDPKEVEVNLGNGNFIFVGSGTDAWAFDIPSDWITRFLDYCNLFNNNYLFQSKDPSRFFGVHGSSGNEEIGFVHDHRNQCLLSGHRKECSRYPETCQSHAKTGEPWNENLCDL